MPRGVPRHRIWASDELRILQKLYEGQSSFIYKVPSSYNRPRGIKDTTCRHSDCPNKVTPPTSYRASLEKVGDCDPANNVIGYEAIDSVKNVRKTPKGQQGRRGLGANGQEWWCLKCLEALFVHLREHVWLHKPDGSALLVHPLTSIQYWIIPERRTIPQFERTFYTLQSPQVHLIAKWQAVKTYDELRNRPAEGIFDLPEDPVGDSITLYLGQDGQSFYLDEATRDIQGVLADNRVCEIDASDVRGYSLSEALRRLDKKEDALVEAKWKPIMAARRRAKEALEEPSYTEGQQDRRKAKEALEEPSCTEGQQDDSSKERENQEECSEATSPVLEESRHAVSILYVGNEPPEKTRKRKRDSPDHHARPSKLPPQAPTLAPLAKTSNQPAQTPSASPYLALSPYGLARPLRDPPSSALHPKKIYPSEGVPAPSVGPTQAGVGCTTRVEEKSPINKYNLNTNQKSGKEDPRADAKGGKTPMALASQTGMSHSARPTTQPFLPSKYAPNPSSKLCNKRRTRATGGAEVEEKPKAQPDS